MQRTVRIVGQPLEHVRVANAFLLRTAHPPISDAEGHRVRELRRVGKRIAIGLDNDLWLVLHLMIGGRLRPVLPSIPCTSLPQIPHAFTATNTSPTAGVGVGTSS